MLNFTAGERARKSDFREFTKQLFVNFAFAIIVTEDGCIIVLSLFFFLFVFFTVATCNAARVTEKSYVAVDLNARCLRRQLRIFAAERKRGFAKLKRFIQIECTRTGETRKTRGSRSQRELFLLRVFFFVPLWTQPFVSPSPANHLFPLMKLPELG